MPSWPPNSCSRAGSEQILTLAIEQIKQDALGELEKAADMDAIQAISD